MRNLLILAVLSIAVIVLVACGSGGLSEQQAIDTFMQANQTAEQVTVNSMMQCDVGDQAKVTYNIDRAWLVNMDFYSTLLEKNQNIALTIGEKDGVYKVIAQGMCP